MNKLYGEVIKTNNLEKHEIDEMFKLMEEFYDNMLYSNFIKDLQNKDYCILLRNDNKSIKGFSTQKIMKIPFSDSVINGVFSGDTIIHKDYWGNFELHRLFADFFFKYGEKYEDFYWFLISKGYKTYKMIPTFFKEAYPNYKEETPKEIKEIINAFGNFAYPNEFDKEDGVIKYKDIKDKLKEGVADIDEKKIRDKHISYFVKINPGYINGNDLVCITKLKRDNLKGTAKRLFGCDV